MQDFLFPRDRESPELIFLLAALSNVALLWNIAPEERVREDDSVAHQKDGGRGCTCAVGREWSCEALEEDEGKCPLYIEIAPTASSTTSIPTT